MQCEVEEVEVNWLCRGYTVTDYPGNKLEHPPRKVKGDMLQRYSRAELNREL